MTDAPRPAAGTQPRGRRWLLPVAVLCVLALLAGGGWWLSTRVLAAEVCRATAKGESVSFDPEQMNHASTMVALGVKRGLPARAGTIAVTTALQESKLRNLTYGDRDSVGLFQQRPSQGWGTEEQLLDPIYATGVFYDALTKVDGWADMRITEIAQEVQRSAYPEAYADHELEGRTIASAVSGHSPGGLACRLGDAEAAGDPDTLVDALREQTGTAGTVGTGPDGPTVTAVGSDETRAWGLGAWAVAQAEARQITRVQVGDREWRRALDSAALEWHEAADPVGATTVVITLAG